MSDTWPQKWGFIGSLLKCKGKTIEVAELVKMPYGCAWSHAWAVRFTDGSRAFFAGHQGTGIISPELDALRDSHIFTPAEYGEYAAALKAKTESRRKALRQADIARLRTEAKNLGLDPTDVFGPAENPK